MGYRLAARPARCCVMPNGAAAAVITPRRAWPSKFRDDYVLIRGVGMSVGTKQGRLDPDYDWVHFDENVIAGARRPTKWAASLIRSKKSTSPACTTPSPSSKWPSTKTSGSPRAARAATMRRPASSTSMASSP